MTITSIIYLASFVAPQPLHCLVFNGASYQQHEHLSTLMVTGFLLADKEPDGPLPLQPRGCDISDFQENDMSHQTHQTRQQCFLLLNDTLKLVWDQKMQFIYIKTNLNL